MDNNNFIILTKDFLIEHYINQNKNIKEISKEFHISDQIISRKIHEYEIYKKYNRKLSKIHNKNKIEELGFTFVNNNLNNLKTKQLFICHCGNKFYVMPDSLLRNHTKSCGCLKNLSGVDANRWNGYQEISLSYWHNIKNGAKNRNLEFNITLEYIWELFLKQNRKCTLSNIKLTLGSRKTQTASLDRIDSSKGYIEDNIQWIHKMLNIIKMDLRQEDFIIYCNLVAKTHPRDV